MAQLVVQIDGESPVVHELTDDIVTIGRETDNVVIIADASVSRRHAEILASDGPRTLRDLNSANGTTVNGISVTQKMLKPGDVIHLGNARVSYITKAPVAAKAPPAVPASIKAPVATTRQQEPPVVPAVKPPVPAPVAREVPPVPVARPLPEVPVSQEKSPPPAVGTPSPARIPKAQAPVAAVREPPSPPAPLPPVKVSPPTAQAALPVEKAPSAPAVPAVQLPVAAKAPLSTGKEVAPSAPVVAPTVTAAKMRPPAVEEVPASVPTGKPSRPELRPTKKQLPARETADKSSLVSVAASELPPVPDGIGRGPSALAPAKQALPAPVTFREGAYAPDDVPSFFTRRRVLTLGAVVLLLAGGTVGALSLRRPTSQAAHPVPPPRVAVKEESKAVATRKCWDQLQEVARVGLQQVQGLPFQQYPVMSNGVYDFQAIDDNALDALMDSLTTRARALSRVSRELGLLDRTGVDADLVAYVEKIGAHWERASGLDFDAVNLAWAVHERRARPVDANTLTMESADVVAGESRAPGAISVTMDHVTKLANNWLAERDKFGIASGKIDVEEKEIYRQLSARYKDQFK